MKRKVTLGISIKKKRITILNVGDEIEIIERAKERVKKELNVIIDSHVVIELDNELDIIAYYNNVHDQIIGWLAYLNIEEIEAETMILEFFKKFIQIKTNMRNDLEYDLK